PWSRALGSTAPASEPRPFGSGYVSISPAEQGPLASSNFNRVYLCGAEEGLTAEGLARIADLFRQAGVDRYYVWLSPGPRMEAVRAWLTDSGMTRHPHVRHPTLARDAGMPPHAAARIEAREMGAGQARHLARRHEGMA